MAHLTLSCSGNVPGWPLAEESSSKIACRSVSTRLTELTVIHTITGAMPRPSRRARAAKANGRLLSWSVAKMKDWFTKNHLDWDPWANGKTWKDKQR